MSIHCNIHHCNNCIECAIEKQTKEIVKAIESLKQSPDKKTSLYTKIGDFLKL